MPNASKHCSSPKAERIVLGFCLCIGLLLPFSLGAFVPQIRILPRLFSLNEGVWRGAPQSPTSEVFAGLVEPVDIAFDSDGIPHVVAQSDSDMFFVQGVLHAHFRLFEMDITTRAAMGRLSEILGVKAASVDHFFITFGMREGVRKYAEAIDAEPKMKAIADAYIKGVNAYIEKLSYRNLPLEYKLTGTWPELWKSERLAALKQLMTFRLAGRSNDLRLTKVLQKLGSERTQQLFPEFLPTYLAEYFSEVAKKTERTDRNWTFNFQTEFKEFPEFLAPLETHGSNSWAVGPSRSKTGYSVLSNDTHLGLSIPAVWFEMQLISPTINVYGATFPGIPGVVLGFTKDLAWGVTNGTADVLDWFEVEFKDDASLEYKIGDGFKTAVVDSETLVVHGAPSIPVSVTMTDYGILMSRHGNKGLVARWLGHQPGKELAVFTSLAYAKGVDDCIKILGDYLTPVQNFTCADEKNISIYHAGHIPMRSSGQGRVVEKATTGTLWKKFIPFDELPHEKNPQRGFVLSANQRPVGPSYPYYMGWDFEEPFRAKRIRKVLGDQKMDGHDLVQMQADALNQHALMALPLLLKKVRAGGFSDAEKTAFESLRHWDFIARAKSIEPSLFSFWWKHVERLLWDEVNFEDRPLYPSKVRTLWFFNQLSAEPETFSVWVKPFKSIEELVTKALQDAVREMGEKFGADPSGWQWNRVQETRATHVAKFPGLDSSLLTMDGSAYSINANKGDHGAAWKLVVEMGPNQRAWAQFPGGVTGHPLDPDYEKFLPAWSRGEMRPVRFWKTPGEASTESMYVWKWRGS